MAVLLVADLLHPVDNFAVFRLGNGDMCHRRGRGCAVPVLFARSEPDHVARTDFLDRTALALHPAAAGRDNQSLAKGMGQAVRAPGSNVTLAPVTRAGAGA